MKKASLSIVSFRYALIAALVMAAICSREACNFIFRQIDPALFANILMFLGGYFYLFISMGIPSIGILAGTWMAQRYLKWKRPGGAQGKDEFLKLSLLYFILINLGYCTYTAWHSPYLVSSDWTTVIFELIVIPAAFYVLSKRFLEANPGLIGKMVRNEDKRAIRKTEKELVLSICVLTILFFFARSYAIYIQMSSPFFEHILRLSSINNNV
jgi:hypothetical protein